MICSKCPTIQADRRAPLTKPSFSSIQALGPVARDVDVPVGHRPDGEEVSLRRQGYGAFDLSDRRAGGKERPRRSNRCQLLICGM